MAATRTPKAPKRAHVGSGLPLDTVFAHLMRIRRHARELVDQGSGAYLGDWKRKRAGVQMIIEVGELVKHLPDHAQGAMPDVRLRAWTDMRNVLAHNPQRIDHHLVWETLSKDLPHLGNALDRYRTPELARPRHLGRSPVRSGATLER